MPFKDPEARKAYVHEWYLTNRPKILAMRKAYHQANKSAISDYSRRYRHDNRPKIKARMVRTREERLRKKRAAHARNRLENNRKSREYSQRHKDERNAYRRAVYRRDPTLMEAQKARRRARRHQASVNDLTAAQWRAIKAHYGYRCVYCQRKMQRLTKDHIVPLSRGGHHTVSNIVPACNACNGRKQDGPPLVPVQPLLLIPLAR